MNILLIDNYDSFTFNIVEMLRQIAKDTSIKYKVNIKISPVGEFHPDEAYEADKVILSPGPGLPEDYPVLFDFLQEFALKKSILGVCMGHQVICRFFGASLWNLPAVVHGQDRFIETMPDSLIFRGTKQMKVGLYHSWAVRKDSLPEDLKITAISEEGVIMGIQHKTCDIHAVQFHPESYITEGGRQVFENFIGIS